MPALNDTGSLPMIFSDITSINSLTLLVTPPVAKTYLWPFATPILQWQYLQPNCLAIAAVISHT